MSHPAPTIQAQLALVTQNIYRSDTSHISAVTFALDTAGTPSLAVAQDTIDDFQTNFNTRFGPIFDSEVGIPPPSIRLGDGSNTPFEAIAAGATIGGGTTATFATPAIAILFKKNTGMGGRKNRGRTYFPYMCSNANVAENGTLDSGSVTGLTAVGASFLNDLVVDLIPMCIANRTYDRTDPSHPFVTAVTTGPLVTTFACERSVATQRRRQPR